MPVAENLFRTFLELYRTFPKDQTSQIRYFSKRRSEMRLLLDSVWEQTVFNILKIRPRNHSEARRAINQANLDTLRACDAAVLRSVLSVLENFDVFASKEYVDYSKRISALVVTSIRRMCLDLAAHPAFSHSALAQQLTDLLKGTK
jgi:hypothetical protein